MTNSMLILGAVTPKRLFARRTKNVAMAIIGDPPPVVLWVRNLFRLLGLTHGCEPGLEEMPQYPEEDQVFSDLGSRKLDAWLLKQSEVSSDTGGVELPKLLEYKAPPKLLEYKPFPTPLELPPKIIEVPGKLNPVSKVKWPLDLGPELDWLTDPTATSFPSSDFPDILG